MPEPMSGCWLWLGSERSNNYGCFCKNGGNYPAHRASYEIYVGPIQDGLVIDHLCRNTWCVNPDHLEPVTRLENLMRGFRPLKQPRGFYCGPRHNLNKTHCARGHELSGSNLLVRKCGRRQCRECHRQKWHRLRAKQTQAVATQASEPAAPSPDPYKDRPSLPPSAEAASEQLDR